MRCRAKNGFCPGVRLHKGITIVLSLFRSPWLAVVKCSVLCSGSCEPVHEDRTQKWFTKKRIKLRKSYSPSLGIKQIRVNYFNE